MGQTVSSLLGWVWSKVSRTPSSSSFDKEDDIHTATYELDINVYAHDPELGVESRREELAANNSSVLADDAADVYESAASYDEQTCVARSTGDTRVSKKRWMGPYNSSHKILLVGEGDFSFSASLAFAFGDASNMTATSLDTLDFLGRNYSRAVRNVLELTRSGCKVMHRIDATRMSKHPSLKSLKFDRIIFNFPHAGFFDYDEPRYMQINRHQELVKGFLANAKKLINEDGEIHITQKTTNFFREWNIKLLASSEGLRLVGKAPFEFQDYWGYRTKFGYGGDENFICYPCKTYKFQLASLQEKV